MAEALSRTSPRLLTLDLSPAAADQVLGGRVALTDTGRSVLAGRLDRVATYGIDRWLGGVHLHGGHTLWRWDNTRQRVAVTVGRHDQALGREGATDRNGTRLN